LLAEQPQIAELTLLDRLPVSVPVRNGVVAVQGDFADSAQRAQVLAGADAVILLAAILGGAAEADPALARRINVDATLDLFDHLKTHNPVARVVFASTIAVYGKPMPDPVVDATPLGPSMLYGAQKLMMEVALTHMSQRGWLDGVSLRPSGVMARDGADAALKSAFMSRLFWAVKRGEDIALPVAAGSRTWLTSIDTVAQNFVHAVLLPQIGANRAFTLPALSLTFGDLVSALHRAFPGSRARVTFAPDPATVSLFGSYPDLITETADRLGFYRDADADALVARSLS
jgi:D-erythronate 2-dehydrogenase